MVQGGRKDERQQSGGDLPVNTARIGATLVATIVVAVVVLLIAVAVATPLVVIARTRSVDAGHGQGEEKSGCKSELHCDSMGVRDDCSET